MPEKEERKGNEREERGTKEQGGGKRGKEKKITILQIM
jgi:hypothetical protein